MYTLIAAIIFSIINQNNVDSPTILEINDINLVQVDNHTFSLHQGFSIKILGSTNGRTEGILFVHMGQIVAGKKIEIEVKGIRYLWLVKTLKINGQEVDSYEFTKGYRGHFSRTKTGQ